MLDRLLRARISNTPKSILLLGPRQVGKSTLIQSLNPDLTLDLSDEAEFLSYSKDAEKLKREISAREDLGLIVIDEIQRIPSLLNTVQSILDRNKRLKFMLTGSSARKLKRGEANLLPGRILLEYLDPLSFWELKGHFDLDRLLSVGSLPGIYLDREYGAEVLGTYATVYLREEIQAEALTKNIGDYARFLDVAAASSGQWINYSKISSDTEIPKETIRRYFQLLEDTLLVYRIPPFRSTSSHRRVSQRDRFVFFDIGVRNSLIGLHKSALPLTEIGGLFEQWVILQCLIFGRIHRKEWRWASYRTDGGAEVDFIIDLGRSYLALECKYGKNVSEGDLRGMRSFEEVAGKPVRKIVVYRGTTRQKFSRGELAVPFETFLDETLPGL